MRFGCTTEQNGRKNSIQSIQLELFLFRVLLGRKSSRLRVKVLLSGALLVFLLSLNETHGFTKRK
jgi:hypothetical protein